MKYEIITQFDAKNFKVSCSKKEINANISFNKRNKNSDRDEYFDKELYQKRYVEERTNAWRDRYRSLRNRFVMTTENQKKP